MFTVKCYFKKELVCEMAEKDRQEALLYAEIMFNAGYRVEVYDAYMFLIEKF